MKKNIQLFLLILTVGLNTSAQLANWTSGTNPSYTNFPVNVSGQINGLCRISQMKFHATNANKLYAVTAEGGFFTSNDAGSNWAVRSCTENNTNSFASICVDRTNDQVIYLGSGDANYYSNGSGIYKSTDGGATMVQTTLNNRLVVEILQDPNNASTFVAATNGGIYKSTNNGTTWVATTSTSLQFCNLKQNAGIGSSILYACTLDNASRFFRSIDFGTTWTEITTGFTAATAFVQGGGRIGVTAADPNVVYFERIGGGGIIHKSNDGGLTFILKKGQGAGTVANPYLTFYDFDNANGLNGQGNYNNTITVDVNDPSKLWLQSHNTWYSIDSGATWTSLTYWAYVLHTDMHQITQSPFNANQLYSCNDGGVWLSTDGGTNWTPKSNGLYAYEIYNNCGKGSRTDRNNITIGTQDNGRVYRNANGWFTDRGGDDSRQKEYDYLPNGGNYYEKTQNIKRAAGGGGSSSAGFTTSGNFWEYLAFNRSNTNLGFMWFTDNNLYRTSNLSTSTPTWASVFTFTQPVRAIHSCIADVNRLYVITSDAKIQVSSNALSASPTFTTYNLPSASGSLASIVAIANNANTVYISINNKVYISVDGGAAWTNITYNLPNVNHRKILAEDFGGSEELVFIATNNAVYFKKAGQTTWTNYSTNLPSRRAPTDFSMFDDGTRQSLLRFTTYGRSVWETPFNNLRTLKANITVGAKLNTTCATQIISFSDNSLGNPISYQWTFEGGIPSTSTLQNPAITYTSNGTYNVTLTLTDALGTLSTQTISTSVILIPTISSPVSILSNPTTADFCIGESVSLTASGGFAPSIVSLGTGVSITLGNTSNSTLGPNPLQNYYGGSKQLMLFTVKELNDIGLTTGAELAGFAVNMSTVASSYVLQNFQVKIQPTLLTSLSNFENTGWTIVRPSANFTLSAVGWNTIPFSTNYTWDGINNILVEVNYSNNNDGSSGNTAFYGTTNNVSTLLYRVDNVNASTINTYSGNPTYSYTARNNVRFTLANNATTYTWLPITGLNVSTGNVVNTAISETSTYTVTASSVGKCPVTASKVLTIKTINVTSSAGLNGSIIPNGNTAINCGTNPVYLFTPNNGYVINDVLVDGVSQGAIASYSFNNITIPHSITVSFKTACQPNTWVGVANNLWDVTSNWDCDEVPLSGANIIINNVTNKPILNANTIIGNLTIASGATLTVGDNELTINGLISGLGTLSTNNNSSIITNSSTNISFTNVANTLKKLTVNNGTATLITPVNITAGNTINSFGTVTVSNGAVLISNGNLTLQSNIYGTARVHKAAVSGNYINGDVTVERYIPANVKRAWRLLSVPTLSSQTIHTAWQESQLPTMNNNIGYGTFITNNIAQPIALYAAGFDYFTTSGSLQKYNSNAQRWDYITSTNTDALQTNKAYFVYIRGDRTVTPSSSVSSLTPTTLRTKGTLYQGDLTNQTVLVGINKFEPIGNLYASSIDFTNLSKTGGLSNTFYIWDPKAGSSSVLGAYQTFNPLNDYKPFLPGSYGTTIGGADPFRTNTLIESGQGFIVTANVTAGSITLVENAKTSGNGQQVFRPLTNISKIKANLYRINQQNGKLVDGNVVAFNAAYLNEMDGLDAKKISNTNGENFGILNNETNLVVDAKNVINEETIVQYIQQNMMNNTFYEIHFNPTNFSSNSFTCYLNDAYLKTSTNIDLTAKEITYTFKTDANILSKDENRFRLSFVKSPLPIPSISFTVAPNPIQANTILLRFNNQAKGKYNIRLFASDGKLIKNFIILHEGLIKTHTLNMNTNLPAGIYTIEINTNDSIKTTIAIQKN